MEIKLNSLLQIGSAPFINLKFYLESHCLGFVQMVRVLKWNWKTLAFGDTNCAIHMFQNSSALHVALNSRTHNLWNVSDPETLCVYFMVTV